MKHHIPEDIIDEVRSRADIVDVVSEYVPLKKSGKNHKGLCPFHSEKTPSFTVSEEKQIYHCFGCGNGGNAFKFLMEIDDLSFVDAVRQLAARVQVPIPESTQRPEGSAPSERESLLHVNTLAAQFFHEQLKHPQKGKAARDYLQSRGFDDAIIDKYQIGWAPDAWRNLLTHLQKTTKYSRQMLDQFGLVIRREAKVEGEEDNYYDRFRGRILFPIQDAQGHIIGFGGRVIGEGEPKYLNTPETAAYKKGRNLFGINRARQAIRRKDRVLIVEGYFDQIRAAQHGIENTVATCGTALTDQQGRLLKQYTQNAVLVFDADTAGHAAAQRGFEVLKEQGLNVHVLTLPAGHDPDSLIRERGVEHFLELDDHAQPFIHYFVQTAIAGRKLEKSEDKLELINQLLPLLSKVQNSVERSEYVRHIAETVGVEDRAFLDELRKSLTQNKPRMTLPVTERKQIQHNPEWYLIHLMLQDESAAQDIREQVFLEEFQEEPCRETAKLFYSRLDAGQTLRIDRLLDDVEGAEVKSVLTRIGLSPITFDNITRAVQDCVSQIKNRAIQEKINELKQQRNEAVRIGESERSRELHDQVQKMQLSLIPE